MGFSENICVPGTLPLPSLEQSMTSQFSHCHFLSFAVAHLDSDTGSELLLQPDSLSHAQEDGPRAVCVDAVPFYKLHTDVES